MSDRFRFRGNAVGVAGHITAPFNKIIKARAASSLPPIGGYGSSRVRGFRHRDFLRFGSAHSEVTGSRVEHKDDVPCFCTVVKSTVEELDVMGMVTADRVVATVASTFKGDAEAEPTVTLLGTRFENLRIAGIPVKVDLAVDLLDRFPRHQNLREAWGTEDVRKLYGEVSLKERLKEAPGRVAKWFSYAPEDEARMPERGGITRMSLVRNLEPESAGLQRWGHVIHVDGFGTIRLAELEISRLTRGVTMIHIDLDCPYEGTMMFCSADDGGSPS